MIYDWCPVKHGVYMCALRIKRRDFVFEKLVRFQRERLLNRTSLEIEAEYVIREVFKKRKVFREVIAMKRYIFDYIVVSLGLVIEVDGPHHDNLKSSDEVRDQRCRSVKLTVIRLRWDNRDEWESILRSANESLGERGKFRSYKSKPPVIYKRYKIRSPRPPH